MKTVLVLTTLVAVALAIPHPVTLDEEWNEYKKSFGKFYTSEEEDNRRLKAYLETKDEVEKHNQKYERGETTYTKGINKFADWFPEELDKLKAFRPNKDKSSIGKKVFELPRGAEVPDKINWVKKGAVTSVKDQGSCGSCYAFSAVGALEGLMFRINKTITSLSAQELVDCSDSFGNYGCNGGGMEESFIYVENSKKISTDKSYPYKGVESKCKAENGVFGAVCTGFTDVPEGEKFLKDAVGTIGPVSIAFGANENFVHYKGGVYDGDCELLANHAMLVVGYGNDKKSGKDYWLVKNSWGPSWGLGGYVKVERGVDKCWISDCGIYPTYENTV